MKEERGREKERERREGEGRRKIVNKIYQDCTLVGVNQRGRDYYSE